MRMIHKFLPGDLVRIKSPQITKSRKTLFHNRFTGRDEVLPSFVIYGVSNTVPFAKILVRKRFICMYSVHNRNQPQFFLYDNYKPEFLGKGYQLLVNDWNIFVKVGEISDVRKMPAEAQRHAEATVSTKYPKTKYFNTRGLTRVEKIHFMNSSPTPIRHPDPGIAYAIMMIRQNTCNECGMPFIDSRNKILHIDSLKLDDIRHRLRHLLGIDRRVDVFPAGYWCVHCNRLTVLASFNRGPLFEFEPFCLGRREEYTKGV